MNALASALSNILPRNVSFDAGLVKDRQGPLFVGEMTVVGQAAAKRQAEFRAGRTCARTALSTFLAECPPIPQDADGCPIWPSGWVGTISHTSDVCVAVVANRCRYLGIGVDVETATPLPAGVSKYICGAKETERADICLPLLPPGVAYGKLLFVIKEAVYKAYFPLARHFLDFMDLDVSVAPRTARFRATIVETSSPAVAGRRAIYGRWGHTNGLCFAVAAIRA